MPDTPPSGWGPVPFDDWDLDNLLSGQTADTPPALRQVADALTALRAAPSPAELSGQAMVMAEFSALADFQAFGQGAAARHGGQSDTLVLPLPSAAARKRGPARHRSQRPGRPVTWRAGALMGAAAAVVILIIVAFSGGLPGPIKSFTQGATSTPSSTHHASGAASEAARSAAPTHPPASPDVRTLCRTWFSDFQNWREPHSDWSTEASLFARISQIAGGPWQAFKLCEPYVKDMRQQGGSWFHPDNSGPHQGGQGNNDSGNGNPGNSNPGNSNSGNGNSGNSNSGGSSSGGSNSGHHPSASSGSGNNSGSTSGNTPAHSQH